MPLMKNCIFHPAVHVFPLLIPPTDYRMLRKKKKQYFPSRPSNPNRIPLAAPRACTPNAHYRPGIYRQCGLCAYYSYYAAIFFSDPRPRQYKIHALTHKPHTYSSPPQLRDEKKKIIKLAEPAKIRAGSPRACPSARFHFCQLSLRPASRGGICMRKKPRVAERFMNIYPATFLFFFF